MIEGAPESNKAIARDDIDQAVRLSIKISVLLVSILEQVQDNPFHVSMLNDLVDNMAKIRSRLQYLGKSI